MGRPCSAPIVLALFLSLGGRSLRSSQGQVSRGNLPTSQKKKKKNPSKNLIDGDCIVCSSLNQPFWPRRSVIGQICAMCFTLVAGRSLTRSLVIKKCPILFLNGRKQMKWVLGSHTTANIYYEELEKNLPK